MTGEGVAAMGSAPKSHEHRYEGGRPSAPWIDWFCRVCGEHRPEWHQRNDAAVRPPVIDRPDFDPNRLTDDELDELDWLQCGRTDPHDLHFTSTRPDGKVTSQDDTALCAGVKQ